MIIISVPPIITGDTPKFTFKVYRAVIEYSEHPPAEISEAPFNLTAATLTFVGRNPIADSTAIFTKTPVITGVLESGVPNECEIQMLPADFSATGRIFMELEVSRPDLNFVGTPIRIITTVQRDIA